MASRWFNPHSPGYRWCRVVGGKVAGGLSRPRQLSRRSGPPIRPPGGGTASDPKARAPVNVRIRGPAVSCGYRCGPNRRQGPCPRPRKDPRGCDLSRRAAAPGSGREGSRATSASDRHHRPSRASSDRPRHSGAARRAAPSTDPPSHRASPRGAPVPSPSGRGGDIPRAPHRVAGRERVEHTTARSAVAGTRGSATWVHVIPLSHTSCHHRGVPGRSPASGHLVRGPCGPNGHRNPAGRRASTPRTTLGDQQSGYVIRPGEGDRTGTDCDARH